MTMRTITCRLCLSALQQRHLTCVRVPTLLRHKKCGFITALPSTDRTPVSANKYVSVVSSGRICDVHKSWFTSSSRVYVGYRLRDNLSDCYSLLNVSRDCSLEELKEAYYDKARHYHPDSQSPTADAKKFSQVKEAYKTIKKNLEETSLMNEFMVDDEDDDDLEIFTRQQPQHRQYLDNEGIGYGTKTERQKQFNQYRVSKAQDRVYTYKVKKLMPDGDNALVAKDKRAARRTKMSNSMDRLVEDMIQESMSRGDFENLPGTGKPLKFASENPYMDRITQKLNKMLHDDDLQPEWIMLQKEIRADVKKSREKLAIERRRLGDSPFTEEQLATWNHHVGIFKTSLKDINAKINKYNLIVPVLSKQMMWYNFEKDYKKIYENFEEYLPEDFKEEEKFVSQYSYKRVDEPTDWGAIWEEMKELIRPKKKVT